MLSVIKSYSLVREGQEEVFLSADSTRHVLLLVVKFVVAGLFAADEFGQRVVLEKRLVPCRYMKL